MRKISSITATFCFLAILNSFYVLSREEKSGKFVLKEDLSIGVELGYENLMFGSIADIDLDSEENIYVLDTRNNRIQKFDKKGNFLKSLYIERGQGPKEVSYIGAIAVTKNGKIYALEENGTKILVFDEGCKFLSSFRIDFRSYHIIPDPEENVIVLGLKGKRILHVFNQDGKHLDSFGKPFEIPSKYSQLKNIPQLNLPGRVDISSNGKIFILNPHKYEINVYEKKILISSIKGKNKAFTPFMIIETVPPGGIGLIAPYVSILEYKDRLYVSIRTIKAIVGDIPNQLDIFENKKYIASLNVKGIAYAVDREGRLYFAEEEDFPKAVRYKIKRLAQGT